MFSFKEGWEYISSRTKAISAEVVGWLAVVCIHCATVPPLIGLLLGVSERLPSIDVVAFLWLGLVLMFVRAMVVKDMLMVGTISVGFIIQALLLAFLVYK